MRARPLIDVHVHLYPPRRLGGLMRWVHRGMPQHPVPVGITIPRAVRDLEEAGVERFVNALFPLSPGESVELNLFNAELAARIPHMIPFGTVHQDDSDPAAVAREALVDLGLRGIKLHPLVMKAQIDDPRIAPVFALAQELGRPILIHTGFEEGGSRPPARAWENLFLAWPRLTFLCAHMFFPDLPFAFSLLRRFDNVVLDMTNVLGMMAWPTEPLPFGIPRPAWGIEELSAAIEANPERVVFGSDHPAGMDYPARLAAQVLSCGLSERTARRVLYENARELFGRLGLI